MNDILDFHEQLDKAAGIREIGLIESAVNAPFQTFDGEFLYPSVEERATRLFYGLAKNHGFVDGNKRVALHATELYLMLNGFVLDCTQEERVEITMKVAASEISAEELLFWIESRINKS